ncbi:MAG: FGGY family carbohydrate kinase [Caldilinea sp.]
MDTILAIDIGTTGAKAALVNRDGALLASALATYPTHTAAGNIVEQTPQEWWDATCHALHDIWRSAPAGVHVAAVILSGQMQDTILLGDDDAIGPALLYSDSRAQVEAAEIEQLVDAAALTAITGNTQGAASVLAKWRWLAAHEPPRLAAARTILLGSHDYVTWRLCGVRSADPTTAATTGLLDWRNRVWATSLLVQFGLNTALLPELHPAGTQIGRVNAAAALATGLAEGTPVLQGVGDLGATTVGVGAAEPGAIYAYLGTSGWLAVSRDEAEPLPERGVFTICHPQPRRWIQVAPVLTAGGNLEWLRSALATPEGVQPDYTRLNDLAAQSAPGSGGVIYLPYLNGERSPFSDPHARAGFLGISGATTQADLVRAVMEGTAFAYRSLREALDVVQRGPLLLAGGGGQSPLWAQILADVLGHPVQVAAVPGDAPARGAAILAGRALGWHDSLTPAADFFPMEAGYTPVAHNAALYDRFYPIFAGLYPALRASFAALAQIQTAV